ncbi:jerky protein homolog-like [Hydra vulgaris]|uniref:Jerky protein homolog-like n=1 Tax=Hydra vulgaris TaxID=6087 RepID=A0ABM4BUM1_HYDVU
MKPVISTRIIKKRILWTENNMKLAVHAVASGMSQRKASVSFKVSQSTLQTIISGKSKIGAKPEKKPMLGELEEKLIDYTGNRAQMGIGFGKKIFITYAAKLAKNWWQLLKKRHSCVSLRCPEVTASIRHMCMDRIKVSKNFTSLEVLIQSKNLQDKPECVWNMDETRMQLEHKPRRVVSRKGSKYIQSRTNGNKETITVICCVNAAGQVIPPHIIGKGKTVRTLYGFDTKNVPRGATWSVSEKG